MVSRPSPPRLVECDPPPLPYFRFLASLSLVPLPPAPLLCYPYLLVVAQVGVGTPPFRFYLLISPLPNPLCPLRLFSPQRTGPSQYSRHRFLLQEPDSVLRSIPTLHHSNACPLALFPHLCLVLIAVARLYTLVVRLLVLLPSIRPRTPSSTYRNVGP